MEGEVTPPAWQLTQLLERPAGIAHHDGHWSVVVGHESAAAETLDDALEAVGKRQAEPVEARSGG